MKTFFIAVLALLLAAPGMVGHAHGGVSNQAGDYVLFLTQSPLSPLAGETVSMTFALKDKKLDAVPNQPLSLKIVEIGDNDPANDSVAYAQEFVTDVNGNFSLSYAFANAHYYDVEVTLSGAGQEPVVIGFLVEVRDRSSANPATYFALGGIAGTFLTLIIRKKAIK